MNGTYLIGNLVDELERARDYLYPMLDGSVNDVILAELLDDIKRDTERYYDYKDSIDSMLEDIEIEG